MKIQIGRFISEDPLRWYTAEMDNFEGVQTALTLPIWIDPYSYVSNDPTNRIDPIGLFGIGTAITTIVVVGTVSMCVSWQLACTDLEKKCTDRVRCLFYDMPPEKQQEYFEAVGVNSQTAYLLKVCHAEKKTCQMADYWCIRLNRIPLSFAGS